MDLLSDLKLNYSQSLIKFLSEYIAKLKASCPQDTEYLSKLKTLYEVANSQINIKPELIIEIEKVVKQVKEKNDSKTNEALKPECMNFKTPDAKSMSDSSSDIEFLTEPSSNEDVKASTKAKKDKSDKYSGYSRHQKSHRSGKCKLSRRLYGFKRDPQSHSVSPESPRHGKSERYYFKKSDKYRSPHDRLESGGNYSSPSKYRTNHRSANDSKLENKNECADRDSLVCRRDRRENHELMFNLFNGGSSTVFNRIDMAVQSNNAKLLDDKLTEFKASELTPRHIKIVGCERRASLTSHIPETKLNYELDLLKPDTTSKKCASTSTLVSEVVVEDSVVQSTSATTEMIVEIERNVNDVGVTSHRKSLNHSNNLQYTDPRLRLREQTLREQQNSSLFYSKPTASIQSYPPAIQSKPGNKIYGRNQYMRPSSIPNIGNNFSTHHEGPHPYPSNMTSQYTMPPHPVPLMNIVIPCSPTYAGYNNRNPTTPMTYGEYRKSKAASEKSQNKIVMNTFNTDISERRLDNVYRSGTFSCTPKKKPHYAAETHNSNITESDWDDSDEIAPRVAANGDREASQIRDPPSESPSTKIQTDLITSSRSVVTNNNQSSVIKVGIQSALKRLLNPNMLPTILNACGRALDDNMISKLNESIQSWNEANQPGNTQIPPTEVVQTVASKAPRKNELEKLNEDIRSMFVCDEVLSPTYRRMHAASSNAEKESVAAVNSKSKKHENQSRDDITIANKNECSLIGDAYEMARRLSRPCSIVLKKLQPLASVNVSGGIVNLKRDGKGKRQIDEIDDTQTVARKKRLSMQTITVKNNNPAWHYLNNTIDCQLCKNYVGNSLISHYVNCHPDNEVFPCRVLPEVADFLRNSRKIHNVERVSTVGPYTSYEFKQSCYFCNETKILTRMGWLHHMSVHTGYYQYKCTVCKKRFSTPVKFHVCKTVRVRGNLKKESLPKYTQKVIFGYLCDLCNFVRLEEWEIKKHLRCEHEASARANATMKFKKVTLLSFPGKKLKIKSNVKKRLETRSRSVAKLDNDDQELHSLKNVFRSQVVQSKAFIAEPNEDDGLIKRGIIKLMKDTTLNSVPNRHIIDKKLSDGINTRTEDDDLIKLNNVREKSKEKKSPATTSYIREDNCTTSILSQTEAKPQTEDKLSVKKEKDSEPGQIEEFVLIKYESLPEDDPSHINEAKVVARAKQCSTQDSTKLTMLPQLTTTVTQPDISTLVTLNASSQPANERDASREVSLKQWLNIPTSKLQKYCKIMLRDVSMFALYKCMDTMCAFTTNDTELMLIHLRNHEFYAVSKINNLLDSNSWLECPYCNEIGDSCFLLLEHIQLEHQSSIFQCPYCFYRSCTDYNVLVHLNQFHQFEQKSILVCPGKPKEYATEKVFIEKSRYEFVSPLRCSDDCEKITFAMDHFVQHMKNSPAHSDKFRCQVCKWHIEISNAAKHLLCHRIGILECVYCLFATNEVERIENHMCNSHPSKFPYICVRLMKSQDLTDEQLRSVESTLSVHLYQSVDPKLFRRCQHTEQQLNFLSPSIELNSILSESQVVPAPVPLKELTSTSIASIDISSKTSNNAETLGSSSPPLVLSGIMSYENFKNAYVSDDYDKYFASQSWPTVTHM